MARGTGRRPRRGGRPNGGGARAPGRAASGRPPPYRLGTQRRRARQRPVDHRRPRRPSRLADGRRRVRRPLPPRLPGGRRPRAPPARRRVPAGPGRAAQHAPGTPGAVVGEPAEPGRQRRRPHDAPAARPGLAPPCRGAVRAASPPSRHHRRRSRCAARPGAGAATHRCSAGGRLGSCDRRTCRCPDRTRPAHSVRDRPDGRHECPATATCHRALASGARAGNSRPAPRSRFRPPCGGVARRPVGSMPTPARSTCTRLRSGSISAVARR